jgi:LmbE family N-acetylglucosaminyl deacetylase
MDILAIGAHPDDIEIGAGALIYKMADLGFRVYFLILTDEKAEPVTRREEARAAASQLGVPADQMIFAGLADGYLRADGDTVRVVRDLLFTAGINPKIVITHTQADSHNDHVETNRIAHAAFRSCIFMQYSIHISSEIDRYAPRVFIDVSGARLACKDNALAAHRSQKARIDKCDLSSWEQRFGRMANLSRAEAFEISYQNEAQAMLETVMSLSDSPFHRFWVPILKDSKINLLYEAHSLPTTSGQSGLHENAGRDQLRQAFDDQWLPSSPLKEKYSMHPDAINIFKSGNAILSGKHDTNQVVRVLFDNCHWLRWETRSENPCLHVAYLYDRHSGQQHYQHTDNQGFLQDDIGVVTRIANPYNPSYKVVCALGCTSFASRMGLEFLSDPSSQPVLARLFHDQRDGEVAFTVDVRSGVVDVIGEHRDEDEAERQ